MSHLHDAYPALRMARATATLAVLGQSYALHCYAALLKPRDPARGLPEGTTCRARQAEEGRVEDSFDNLPV